MSIDLQRPDVALIAPYPRPRVPSASGVAWYSQNLARALADEGASVTVLAPAEDADRSSELDGRVRVRRCFSRRPAGLLKAAGAALRSGAPVTHVQHEAFLFGGPQAVPGFLGCLGMLRGGGAGPVVTMHQVVSPEKIDRSFTELHRVGIPAPVARAAMSTLQGSIGRIARRTIVHEAAFAGTVRRSVVLPLGLRRGPADAAPEGRTRSEAPPVDFRAANGIGPGDFLVLCFGFVAPYKGLEAALTAAELAGPPVHLVVAGAEHPRLAGQDYLEGLERRFGAIATFTGYVPEEDVSGWFQAADVALLAYPTAFSSSGVLALAVEHGVPALLSSALGEVVGLPSRAGTSIEPSLLADRLRALASRGTDLAELARWTTALSEGRSWPHVAKRHLEIYEEVTNAQRAASRSHRA
ncbi:MAG TPA: glycosyltransferase [Acidimicrobiales bacterium]|nr:glycosyltransferase [Acidimicrobiales bacterium]